MKRYLVLILLVSLGSVFLSGCLGGGSGQTGVYQISGQITRDDGRGIPGVVLTIQGKAQSTKTVTTDEEGRWTTSVSGAVSVTPQRIGVDFVPKVRNVTKESSKDVNFQGKTSMIVGRVGIEGQEPDRPITLRLEGIRIIDGVYHYADEDEFIETDALGHFAIAPEDYAHLDYVRVKARSKDSYDPELMNEMGLISWFNVEHVPIEARFLPDIDLYGYGFSLITPESGETVSFPYLGEISTYDRDVDLYYKLYFYAADGTYLGYSAMSFLDETYDFDGRLQTGGVLDRLAVWYIAGFFEQDDISISVNSYGNVVACEEEELTALQSSSQTFDSNAR